ncbi:RNF4 ligase, partial [Pomatostomus ruficeps]|nr:RNF4 ligase [Pomatostomus ruficeps]
RKRRGGAADSSRARKRSRLLPSSTGGMSHTEPIDFEESGTLSFEPAGGEIIDLTGESSEREVIIISDDESAVVRVQDRKQSQQYPLGSRSAENSAEPWASDNEEESRDNDEYVIDKVSLQSLPILSSSVSSSAQPGVVIRCPICMEFYSEIMQSGRLIVATMCGHIFCSACLPVALETIGVCPTCRAELTPEMYIPIYL